MVRMSGSRDTLDAIWVLVAIVIGLTLNLAAFYLVEKLERGERQFSLRALLIAMTLVAIAFGLTAYALRK
jgi:hypothetical protein